jgi:hypothetical protein
MNLLAPRNKGRQFLLLATLLVGTWLVVLPWIGRLPGVSDHIQTMKDLRIHPDAMFYTELESSSIRDEYDEPMAKE